MAIRTAPNRFAASTFPTELVLGVASYLDLRSLGAFARTDKALHKELTTKPLLYIRIRAQLEKQLVLPVLSEQSGARLTSLSDEFISRQSLRPSLVKVFCDHAILGSELRTESWGSNYAAAMDAQAALLRGFGEAIRKDFTADLKQPAKEFILQCLQQNADLIDKAKFHLLVGEWLRVCARAANWDAAQLKRECKLDYSHYALLDPAEWEQIFALATSSQLKKLCYLDLTNHDELKPGRGKPEPGSESAEGKRKKLEEMPVWEAMDTLAENFEELLGDLSGASGQTLEALLERASFPNRWDSLAAAFDVHAKLLRSMCPVLCSAHDDKRKKRLAEFCKSLTGGLSNLMRLLDHWAGTLDKNQLDALHSMLGELLRTHILTLPSRDRTEKRLNAWYGPCFGNPALIDRGSWDAMLRLALTRTKEPLSYQDLQNEKALAKPKEKARRHSAQMHQPSTKEKDENKSDGRQAPRRRTTYGALPTPAETETSGNKVKGEKEREDADSQDSELRKDDVTGNRYDKEKCTVS